jgi:DNA-binding CsgD family transcriptional regulator
VRGGLSGTLVVRGDPGIGKTALLDYAVDAAPDFLIVRFSGVEAERRLGFAALHRLLLPILHQIERLPAPQRDAMNSALGLTEGPPASRFLVGLGTISLAANAARARGRLLTIIDDAQWVDRESLEALAFWGRRLQADRIALIFGERSGAESHDLLDDFSVLDVGSLDDASALELLARETGFVLDRDVAQRIVAETEGNPLALVEIAKDLSPELLVGAAATPQPLPLTRRLEERFLRQVRSLPADTQMLLLLAAADSSADAGEVWKAASVLGVPPDAAASAEAADLIMLGTRIVYRHPLIRSAVYGGARPADRRAVHGALAAVTDGDRDPDRRVWHLASAAVGPDEEIAAVLQTRAERARARGSHAAEVAFLERSAALSTHPERAAERRLRAAEAALAMGSPRQTHILVGMSQAELRDPGLRARAERADAIASLREGNLTVAAPRLLSAAVGLMPDDPERGRRTLLEALEVASYRGLGANDPFVQQIARVALSGPADGGSTVDLLLEAFALLATAGYSAAAPVFKNAVCTLRQHVPTDELVAWITLAGSAARVVWDNVAHEELLRRAAQASREAGALNSLGIALSYAAYGQMWAGRLDAAAATFDEAAEAFAAAGEHSLPKMDFELSAMRGHDADVQVLTDLALSIGESRGLGATSLSAHMALVVLHLGRGRYHDALEHALPIFEADELQVQPHLLPDLVEAAARAGDDALARKALSRLAERAPAAGTPWALGLLARSQALMSGEAAEQFYREAIDHLGAADMRVDLARAHLLYGEWLRRQKRRMDARDELRAAYESFARMGAEPFADRARSELLATGERARRRSVETVTDLTPQEAHIARLAAAGATNADIAAQLFIGTSTVEYHLRKVFRKLDVTSRRQLKQSLPRSLQP